MRKDYEKLFSRLETPEPPTGIFDRILLAIKREQELNNAKRLVFGFLALLVISLTTLPFSWSFLSGQIKESGVFQFINVGLSDVRLLFASWQEFILAIAESLPIVSIAIFVLNMILALFTVRLFLYKKRLLVDYLFMSFNKKIIKI